MTDDERKQIEALLLDGNKIEAIKAYREQTGLGLAEAKDAIEQMERTLVSGGSAASHTSQSTARGSGIPDGDRFRIETSLLGGKKIEAIKIYREITGAGLKEAKHAVEQVEQNLRGQGRLIPKPSGCMGMLASLLILFSLLIMLCSYR